MKQAAVIGASAEAVHTIEAARRLGVHITALDGDPAAAGLRAADEAVVIDISQEAAVIGELRRIKAARGLDFLLTAPIGRYLTTTGAANDALGLPGVSKAAAQCCTDKWLFHETLAVQGLRDCRCLLVRAGEKLDSGEEAILHRMRFPVVMKPRYGSGSRGIEIARNEQELVQPPVQEDCVLEELAPGEEYGVDGAVTGDTFHLILLRKKRLTPLPARQAVGYFSVVPAGEQDLPEQVAAYLQRVVRALGLRDALLHADLMLAPGCAPFVVELSARPSGHFLHDLFTPLATGVDPAAEMIRCRMGEPYCFVPRRVEPLLIRYFDFTGRAARVPDEQAVWAAIEEWTATENGSVGTSADGYAGANADGGAGREALADDSIEAAAGDGAAGVGIRPAVSLLRWECHIREGERLAPPNTGHVLMERGYFILRLGGDVFSQPECERLLESAAECVLGLFAIEP